MTSDAAGNIYVAGTTSSPDLPVLNAAQPAVGEAALLRSFDNGATWQKVNTGLFAPMTVTPHPTDPQTIFAGAKDGIYQTTDAGQTWRNVYAGKCCFYVVIDPSNPRYAYAYAAGLASENFVTTTDGGVRS
jgi:photosystem II stability/assembly factor-like uncharacterized protein